LDVEIERKDGQIGRINDEIARAAADPAGAGPDLGVRAGIEEAGLEPGLGGEGFAGGGPDPERPLVAGGGEEAGSAP